MGGLETAVMDDSPTLAGLDRKGAGVGIAGLG